MRISDWSSDVCSSDLGQRGDVEVVEEPGGHGLGHQQVGLVVGPSQDVAALGEGPAVEVAPGLEQPQDAVESSGQRFGAASHLLAEVVEVSARSEGHTSELQSLMRISSAVFCLKKKKHHTPHSYTPNNQTSNNNI